MNELIVSIILGVLVFLFITSAFSVKIPEQPDLQRRLEAVKTRTQGSTVLYNQSEESFLLYSNYKFKSIAKLFSKSKLVEYLRMQILLSGSKIQVDSFIILSFICFGIFATILFFTSTKLIAVSLIGLFIPVAILKIVKSKRDKDFSNQLPDTLDMLSSSLRAGHSIYSSFEIITKEMPDPVKSTFKIALDEMAIGSDSRHAINSLTKLNPDNMDLRFFITSVILQREIGGNLAKILDKLSATIRERVKLSGQLKAQTAQARFSGTTLILTPIGISAILFVLSPDYMSVLLDTQQGNMAIAGAVCLLLIGTYCINKIINIEI